MHDENQTVDLVVSQLRVITGRTDVSIDVDTELYGDLHIHGYDLWELAVWLHREFGVEGPFFPNKYGPPENYLRLPKWLRRVFRLKEAQYESLTVRHVLSAIEAKRWPRPNDT